MKGLTVSFGSLELGVVRDVVFSQIKRIGDVDIPSGIGSSIQDLGKQAMNVDLSGVLLGEDRFSSFDQLERAKRVGSSQKFDCDMLKSVAFLKEVKLLRQNPRSLHYGLSLKESRFKQVNACDNDVDWSAMGTLLAVTSPEPKEGSVALKVSGINVDTLSLTYDPDDLIDLNNFDWLSFWFILNSLTHHLGAIVKVYTDENNYGTYDFSSLISAAGSWLKLRIPKSSFVEVGSLEWDEIDSIIIEVSKTNAETWFFVIDDLGGYE
jgi:hypothetical protein